MSTFDGHSVLITGGGTGIGKGCAQHFLGHGATVTIAGPDGDVLESAAAELRNATGRGAVRTAVCDVTDEELVQRAMATAAEDGRLDVLVANAGTGWPGPVQLMDKAQWHIAYDVNVVGTALCIKHASPVMRGRGTGAVVAISSVEALRASKFMPAYNVTKAALDSSPPRTRPGSPGRCSTCAVDSVFTMAPTMKAWPEWCSATARSTRYRPLRRSTPGEGLGSDNPGRRGRPGTPGVGEPAMRQRTDSHRQSRCWSSS